jgi:hypothetical protein
MSSIRMVSSYEPACSYHGWEVCDRCHIAAYAFGSCSIMGWVWALSGSGKM